MLFWFVGTAVVSVWLVFHDARFDYRFLIVGALWPDLVDAPFGGARMFHSVVGSDFWMASDLGACSPTTMCRKVMAENPTKIEIVCRTACDSMPSQERMGSRSMVNTGSPTQPSPKLARVMPSWLALSEASRL